MKFCGTIPCDECPWRKDIEPGQFPVKRFETLRNTVGPTDEFRPIFACHKSEVGNDLACVGYLIQYGWSNLHVRMAMSREEVNLKTLESPFPLYETYEEMAVANGAEPVEQSPIEGRGLQYK